MAMASASLELAHVSAKKNCSVRVHLRPHGEKSRKQGSAERRCRRRARNPLRRSGRSRRPQTRQAAPRHLHRRRCSYRGGTGLRSMFRGLGAALLLSMWMHALERLRPNSTGCRCLRATRSSIMNGRSTTAARSWPSSAVWCALCCCDTTGHAKTECARLGFRD